MKILIKKKKSGQNQERDFCILETNDPSEFSKILISNLKSKIRILKGHILNKFFAW